MTRMRKVIVLGLTGLLLVACSIGSGDESEYNMEPSNKSDVIAQTEKTVFEGVWSIDDMPVEQSHTLTYYTKGDSTFIVFPTFPYEAVVRLFLPDVQNFHLTEPAPLTFPLVQVGYSHVNNYYEQAQTPEQGTENWPVMFSVTTAEESSFTVSLSILPSESTFAISKTAANCLLVVKRMKISYPNEQPRTWVLNPERRLTFISTRRLN